MFTLRQYLSTLDNSYGLTRTLGEVDVCRDARGRMCYSAGNSAAVFRIRHAGRICSLRCYFRPMRNLRAIYGERLLEKELFLFSTPDTGSWADVVLGDWIEGPTLQEAIAEAAEAGDTGRLNTLTDAFDRLAVQLLCDDEAHGDLKPDNIIVGADGTLQLIDFDASFRPAFAGQTSPELGTAAWQHPARTAADFNAALDDFPIALIATALHALRLDPTLYDRHRLADGLLFTPRTIATDRALREAMMLFEQAGLAVRYRIAELLLSPTLRLFGLAELFRQAVAAPVPAGDELPELFVENGRWGYRTPRRIVVPPLYDCGFDFTETLAAVRLHDTWHFIDTAGHTAICCPGCDAVKPFRDGRAQIIRNGIRTFIAHPDRETNKK